MVLLLGNIQGRVATLFSSDIIIFHSFCFFNLVKYLSVIACSSLRRQSAVYMMQS